MTTIERRCRDHRSGSSNGRDGAAQGLGRALAAGLIDRGVSVVLADIASERLQTIAHEFTAGEGRALPVVTDVGDAAAVDALAGRTLEHFGRIDLVVNNASIGGGGQPLWHTDPADWQRVVAVKVFGVAHGSRCSCRTWSGPAPDTCQYRLVIRAGGDAIREYLLCQQIRGGRHLRDAAPGAEGDGATDWSDCGLPGPCAYADLSELTS